jgi:hypothetical protein
MRGFAAIALASLGCNQIFGLAPTDPLPDAPPILPRVRLTWQIADKRASEPSTRIEFPPLDPAPTVRIARLGSAWTDADYQPDGSIEVPDDFPGTSWRIEYTFDGGASEVHWNPARNDGHLTVPRVGRLERAPVPAGGGYRITPVGGAKTHPRARVYTTGIWTDGELRNGAETVDYPLSQARPLSGPIGAPDAMRGDRAIFVDIAIAEPCATVASTAAAEAPALTTTLTSISPSYSGEGFDDLISYAPGDPAIRLIGALGSRVGLPAPVERTVLGYVASGAMPDFIGPVHGLLSLADPPVADPPLPGPALLPLADCRGRRTQLPLAIRALKALVDFPLVVHLQTWDERRPGADGPVLSSGLAASATSTTNSYSLETRVPFARAPIRLGAIDLDAADRVPVSTASGPLELTFGIDSARHADFYELVLYEVERGANARLVRTRALRSALPTFSPGVNPSITFEPSILTPAKEYVLSIHAYLGRPGAFAGDYARVEYPQAMTTIFTRTFVAQ